MTGDLVAPTPVAVIGLACRFSGGEGYRAFWSHLAAGDDLVTEIPAERWPLDGFYSPDFNAPDRSTSKWGSFLEGVAEFDHRFFEISPREARSMDPQQRLLLEEAWRCVEDSGVPLSRLRAMRTGVYVGMMSLDYAQCVQQAETPADAFAGSGGFGCMLANRVSYFLGLTGPSVSLDTACSSSLVALHQARQALLAGEVDYALVAGVSLNLTPQKYLSFSKARMLSPDGRCKTFDQAANGYVPGEGIGLLLLQRADEAAGERNFAHGIIKGSAVNHGGAAVSLTAPQVQAQKEVILAAYLNAGISPASVTYVEAHGTGTSLGDPIEFEALTQAFREHTAEEQFCVLGSVKTNIGHLEPAAGMAGVFKVLLMMRERQIPPSLHLRKANPLIELKGSPFRLAGKLAPWEGRLGVLRAGVSSFGFGGVNSHVLIEAPAANASGPADDGSPRPFLLSAKTARSLSSMVGRWIDFTGSSEFAQASWADITATLTAREQFEHRIGLWATKEALREALQAIGPAAAGRGAGPVRIVLGSFAHLSPPNLRNYYLDGETARRNWEESGLERAWENPALRDFCAAVLVGTRANEWIPKATDFMGAGAGYLAALCAGGCLDEKQALQFLLSGEESAVFELKRTERPVYDSLHRAFLRPAEPPSGYFEDLLATAALSPEQWRSLVEKAADLLPAQHTFRKLLEGWAALLGWDGQDISRWMGNAAATLSPDSTEGRLTAFAIGAALRKLHRKWGLPDRMRHERFAEVLQLIEDERVQPGELVAFLRRRAPFPARFKEVRNIRSYPYLRSLLDEAAPRKLTVRKSEFTVQPPGIHGSGAPSAKDEAPAGEAPDMLRFDPAREGDGGPGPGLTRLWSEGVEIDWGKTPWGRGFAKVPLPVYSFDRTRFWIDEPVQPEPDEEFPLSREGGDGKVFRGTFRRGLLIESHRIGDERLVPGALWLHLGCRAYAESSGERARAVRDFQIVSPLWVKNAEEAFEIEMEGTQFKGRGNGGLCSSGRVVPPGAAPGPRQDAELLRRAGGGEPGPIYQRLEGLGYHYGPALQVVRGLGRAGDLMVARIEFRGGEEWNPFLLDGLLQAGLLAAFDFGLAEKGLWLPCRAGEIRHWTPAAGPVYATVEKAGIRVAGGQLLVDISAYNETGDRVAAIEGLDFRRVDPGFGREGAAGAGSSAARSKPGLVNATLRPGPPPQFPSEELKSELRQILVEILQVDAKDVDEVTDLREYGLESISFTEYAEAVGARYGVEVDPVLLYGEPTVEGLARALGRMFPEKFSTGAAAAADAGPGNPDGPAPKVESDLARPPEFSKTTPVRDGAVPAGAAAIIGMAGRFPKAANLEEFWANLVAGKDLITEIPKSRWDWEEYFGDPREQENKTCSKWGGFVEDADRFDAEFFKLSPREAELMDPQQRWVMELAWEVMEDAGLAPSEMRGRAVGVFIGVCHHDYQDLVAQSADRGRAQAATGNYFSMIANRVSYFFDWSGPSLAIDTACSSSLVALDCALKALEAGDCEMAVAGGVNLCCTPGPYLSFSDAGMLSPEGRCRSFSAAANGYARGEGAGLVLLRPLTRALENRDQIHAVVRGAAVNHGGTATSLTAPNPNAQAELIMRAFRRAGVGAESIGYIEAHGTGTQLGDPIEAAALASAFKQLGTASARRLPSCGIGSVKTNIGHLESAAGIAGVIKTVLALKHDLIPASLHCQEINSHIDFAGSPFYVVRKATPWPAATEPDGKKPPRRAGVSSFGFGGANAHVVLEEAPPPMDGSAAGGREMIVLSARTEQQLKEVAQRLGEWLGKSGANAPLRDVAHTLQTGREAFEWRLAMIAADQGQARELLRFYLAGNAGHPNLWTGHSNPKSEIGKLLDSPAEREFCVALARNGDWRKLAGFWVSGSRLPFEELFGGGSRISLPTYPFANERHWLPKKAAAPEKPPAGRPQQFFDSIEKTEDGELWRKSFRPANRALADYRVAASAVLPGAALLEMICRAGETLLGRRPSVLVEQVAWLQPVRAAGANLKMELRSRREPEAFGFELRNGAPGCVARAKMPLSAAGETEAAGRRRDLDVAGIQARTDDRGARAEVYARFARADLHYGPAFQVLQELRGNEREGFAAFSLPASPRPNEEDGRTLIFDAAFQTVAGSMEGEPDGLFLPFSAEAVELTGEAPRAGRAHARLISRDGDSSSFDIDIADSTGEIVGRIRRLVMRRVVVW